MLSVTEQHVESARSESMQLCLYVGGKPLSPTAASTTVGSPTPFTFSCSVASSSAQSTGATASVFELNKPASGQHYDDSSLPPTHYSHPSLLPRSVCLFVLASLLLFITKCRHTDDVM